MSAGTDLVNAANGEDGSGGALPWRWVYGRARTILGHNNKIPFSRGNTPASPSEYDAQVCGHEQTGSRYIASDGNVWDLHDLIRVQVELLIAHTPAADLAAARAAAGVLRPWPAGYAGTPPFEVGK
jgi:uncharacterized protein (UPF0264 family)